MKMKIPKLFSRKKLRATTARRSLRASAEMDYDDIAGPNMKLSRALLIVLLLHVVAVSGIIAFNAIKTRERSFVATDTPSAPAAIVESTKKVDKVVAKENAQPMRAPVKSSASEERKSDHTRSSGHVATDSGKTYIVVKGDNPVTIAKKFKVAYDDLIGLNHIEDPRKLQIGTKLLIPNGAKEKKTSE